MTEEDLTKQAVDSIHSLLTKEGVKKILYIDDKFDEEQQKEFFIGQMKAVKNSQSYPDGIPLFETINWTSPQAVFEKQILDFWNIPENKKKGIHEICEYIGGDEGANVIPALEIEDYLTDYIELLTPQEWQERMQDELQQLNSNETLLCLFDYELKGFTGNNGEKDGIELAKRIIESKDGSKVFCGIFSHKYQIEEEDEYRQQYSSTYDLDIETFCTISKKRFGEKPKLTAFAEGIKNVLSLKYIEDLKHRSIDILKQSFDKSIDEIKALSPKTFNQIVQKASSNEGVWEANSLFRLNSIIQNYSNYKLFTDDNIRSPFETTMSRIRNLDFIDTGYKFPHKDQKAIDIHKKEVYYEKDIINKLHFSVSNGDIFKIGEKEYILLSQPCNLAIRGNGKRGYDYNRAFLLPLIKVTDDTKELNSIRYEKLRSVTPEYRTYADFPLFKTISLDIIDLCVFNKDGKCFIDLNVEKIENDLIHYPSLERYIKIHQEFSKQGRAYIAFNDIKGQVKGELKGKINMLNPFFKKPECIKDLKLGNHNLFNVKKKTFDFGIQRIKNYRSPYSTDLLQKFMQYMSRNGFDVDFTIE
ncbi:hypothetical protein AB9K26_12800 [Psychroserpens sp. XS_ASV72]|uniref:hypothetical protein n=1 Tax=Psychroserpens sp. XS_ASV72 TaxID=3241293 RepID=UPI00351125C1